MSHLDVAGARLYYETHGSGPIMVMIAGAGGTCGVFRKVAEHLAAYYTVVLYDRRGFSRSQVVGPQDYSHRLATDADDVRHLTAHIGNGPATIFGSSSGAIVALTVLTNHPSMVKTVVAHEPPAVRQLPDGQQWLDFWRSVYQLYQTEGIEPAMEAFRARTFPESDVRVMANAPKDSANAAYWFEHELRQYPAVELDLDALQRHAGRIVLAAGRDSVGYTCRQVTAALADKLDRAMVGLPGGHIGFVSAPEEFARELLDVLGRTGAPVPQSSSGQHGHGDTHRHANHLSHHAGDDRIHQAPHSPGLMSAGEWDDWYAATPHWDLDRPQPAIRALADAGAIRGRVLDVGCGTGEHVLMCAALGLDATGVDIAPAAVRIAEHKARQRGLTARFLLGDALRLRDLGETYDTVVDCGLFHILNDKDLATYVDNLRQLLIPGGRYLMLCFSDQEPGNQGPRRVTREDITTTFADGWRIDSLEPTTLHSPTGSAAIQGWRVAATRI